MTHCTLRIRPGGEVHFVRDGPLQALTRQGPVQLRRASHIQPVCPPLRWLFRSLRRLAGDDGRLAAWTRRWPCRWRVDLRPSDGPVLKAFADRPAALAAEHAWLAVHILGRGGRP